MIILLTGLPGAGKASIGQKVASKLGMRFIDMDERVLLKTGFKTINDVYAFRKSLWKEYELMVSKELSAKDNIVVACTGGIVENELNMMYFEESPHTIITIYLTADPKTLAERVSKHHLKEDSVDFKQLVINIRNLHEKRDELYKRHATFIVNTFHNTIPQSVSLISQYLKDSEKQEYQA